MYIDDTVTSHAITAKLLASKFVGLYELKNF